MGLASEVQLSLLGEGAIDRRGDRLAVALEADQERLAHAFQLAEIGGAGRRGRRSLLEIVGEAGDGEEAVSLVRAEIPDLVLMDVRMPGIDGLEATRIIAAERKLADVRIVILTTFELDEYVFDAMRSGASGFLLKDTEPVNRVHQCGSSLPETRCFHRASPVA